MVILLPFNRSVKVGPEAEKAQKAETPLSTWAALTEQDSCEYYGGRGYMILTDT